MQPQFNKRYNWIHEPWNVMVYLGKRGAWHQFALADKPTVIWCEALTSDLRAIEETKD